MSSSASVTAISPVSGPIAGGTPVTITGSGFAGASAVAFGAVQATPTSVSATSITVNSPAAAAGSVSVQVNVPTGLSPVNPNVNFQYIAPAPAGVTGVSPALGPIAGGTAVTITGSGFTGATAVVFGTVQVAPTSVTDTAITVSSPSTTKAGSVNVQVDVPTGLTPITSNATFQFLAPVISSISPASGPVTGGTVVTIVGSYLGTALTVQFGGVAAPNPPVIVSDSEITVVAPVGLKTGSVGIQVNLPTGLIPAKASDAPQFTYAPPGPPVNAQFVVVNQTGVPDELVFVKFLGAQINTTNIEQTYASWKPLNTGSHTADKSYNLADMTSNVGSPHPTAPLPNFALNDYSGGRIYFSLAQPLASTTTPAAQDPNDPDFSTVYGYVEPSVFPNSLAGNTNLDASYVDFVGLPISIAIKNTSDGSLARPPVNNPLTTPGGQTLFNALTGDTNIPAQTVVAANCSGTTGTRTVSIGGTARILSPSLYIPSLISGAVPYHGWTGANSLIATLRTNKTLLKVASYVTTDNNANVPAGTLFGFAGSKATSPISTAWVAAQGYALTAQAVSDLNPNGTNPRIPHLQGVAGIVMTGNGDNVGTFSIYLIDADLNAPSGVYGANPPYVVDWTGQPGGAAAHTLTSIVNDLSGRVVGDLLAGFNFGWAACGTTVSAQATATSTTANLAQTVFDVNTGTLASAAIGGLSTGQFFYLLSLQPNTAAIAQWFGSAIQPSQPGFYNNYASDFQSLTNAYNMAFTDRLQGASDPDMFFQPGNSTYVEITLLPGAYTVTTTQAS